MADLPSSIVKINDLEVSADAPVSEALFVKIGSTINGVIDEQVLQDGRITTLETAPLPATAESAVSSSSATSVSATITAPSGRVLINVVPGVSTNGGQLIGSSASNSKFELKRGSTVIARTRNSSSFISLGFTYTDFSAGTGANTYTFSALGSNIIESCKIQLIEIK